MDDATTPTPDDRPGDEQAGFDLDRADAAESHAPAGAYRVLARKYRPSTFDDLIGQEALVRTVSNAFETGRIPQAWILTGVRGVGKTTTARILARALNYELPDGSVTGPTIRMPTPGTQCQAIMESRHIDVIEMDAASHNGVDDIRQINDAVRYAPVNARYKVYILDEVHMLSPAAFNALLKTLEEPPPHAKFVFATTEIRKVPVTVLSRCQRFDLRRVETGTMIDHLKGIATKEGIETEPTALALVARAAEGSVRDALSLLDQAIAHAAGSIRAEDVRSMLGLADRSRVIDLFEALMKGDIATALDELRNQYDSGADPSVVLSDLAEFTHFVTRVKIVPAVAEDLALAEDERTRGRAFATALSMRVLSRTWQMLLKGIAEVRDAGRPIAAAEMVLVRIAYAADLPTPDEALRMMEDQSEGSGGASGTAASSAQNATPRSNAPAAPQATAPQATGPQAYASRGPLAVSPSPQPSSAPQASLAPQAIQAPQATPQSAPTLAIHSFDALVALASDKRDIQAKMALERNVRLVRCEDGMLEIALEEGAPHTLVNDLSRKFQQWTGRPWKVVVSRQEGAPTLKQQAKAKQEALEVGVQSDPLVKAVLERFPGAQITRVEGGQDTVEELPPPAFDDDASSNDDDNDGFGDNWIRED